MMAPVIRIDDDIERLLKRLAVELDMVFGTPNQVLRRVLGVEQDNDRMESEEPSPVQANPRVGHNTFVTGRRLARTHELTDTVQQAYYRRTGDWYQLPTAFPVVFFDESGYVVISSESAMFTSTDIQVGKTVHIREGIASLAGYNKCNHTH